MSYQFLNLTTIGRIVCQQHDRSHMFDSHAETIIVKLINIMAKQLTLLLVSIFGWYTIMFTISSYSGSLSVFVDILLNGTCISLTLDAYDDMFQQICCGNACCLKMVEMFVKSTFCMCQTDPAKISKFHSYSIMHHKGS